MDIIYLWKGSLLNCAQNGICADRSQSFCVNVGVVKVQFYIDIILTSFFFTACILWCIYWEQVLSCEVEVHLSNFPWLIWTYKIMARFWYPGWVLHKVAPTHPDPLRATTQACTKQLKMRLHGNMKIYGIIFIVSSILLCIFTTRIMKVSYLIIIEVG